MPITYAKAKELKDSLGEDYKDRLDACRRLRELWHGRFYDEDSRAGLSQLIDGAASAADLRVVHNILHKISVKFTSYLGPLPMIRVPVDPPHSRQRKEQANLKERVLYGTWGDGNMKGAYDDIAWYLPLMGDGWLGAWPDLDRNLVKPLVRSPEYAYPVPTYDGSAHDGTEAVIFCWETDEKWVRRSFPNWRPSEAPAAPPRGLSLLGRRPKPPASDVEVLEYSDRYCFMRWVGGKLVTGVEHDLGFNLFDRASFMNVPGEPHGHGAVEQIVGMNELTNLTISMLFQTMLENAYPTLVLIDPSKAPEQIVRGAGSVIPLNAGGNVAWLHPPTAAIQQQMGFLGEVERQMKEAAAMPDANFGNIDSSIVTGKAVNELVGVGSGTVVTMAQSNLGGVLVGFNSKALYMYRNMFQDEQMRMIGLLPHLGAYTSVPRSVAVSFRGNEIVGSYRNDVIYMANLNEHEKLVQGLQAVGGGLISKKHAREQIGIPDSEAMEEEILMETLQDGMVGALLQELQQSPDQETADRVGAQAVGFIEGTAIPASTGPPLPELPAVSPEQFMGGAAPPGMPPEGGAPPGAGPPAPGGAASGGGPAPGGALPAGPGAPPGGMPPPEFAGGPLPPPGAITPPAGLVPEAAPPGAGGERITIDQAAGMFQALEPLAGRVFLVGEIVAAGQAATLEVALTEPTDREEIMDALPELAGRVKFITVEGEPSEPWLEVTPGQPPGFGGEELDVASVLG